MDAKNLIILVILAIAIFVVGSALGIGYQAQKCGQGGTSSLVATLSSKVVPSIIAYGNVVKIDGKKLTLSYSADSITVLVAEDAKIFSFTQSATNSAPVQTQANFNDIKVGSSVNVSLKMLATGELQGTTVIILPATSQTTK